MELKTKKMEDKKYILGNLPFVEFLKGNDIVYYQDFSWKKPLPSNVKFHPLREDNNSIWFISDGYGILKDNKFGLNGSYGNGAINVDSKHLPKEVLDYCRLNFLEKK